MLKFNAINLANIEYWQDKNIVYAVYIKPDLTPEDVKKIIDTIHANVPDKKFGIISDFIQINFIIRETRHIFATYRYEDLIAAAVIYNDLLQRGLGNLFLKFSKPKYPTKFFSSMEEAEKWLLQEIKKYNEKNIS